MTDLITRIARENDRAAFLKKCDSEEYADPERHSAAMAKATRIARMVVEEAAKVADGRANIANVDQNDNIKRDLNIAIRDEMFDLATAIRALVPENEK